MNEYDSFNKSPPKTTLKSRMTFKERLSYKI